MVIPTQLDLYEGADSIHQRQPSTREQQPQPYAAQQKVVQVDDRFVSCGPAQLCPHGRGPLDWVQLPRLCAFDQVRGVLAMAPQQPQSRSRFEFASFRFEFDLGIRGIQYSPLGIEILVPG
jgi:hypothetical protein